MTVKVKICGITNLEDALAATAFGADYLGFIFYNPSKRAVTVDKVVEMAGHLRQLPHCPILVGVFVNEASSTMLDVLQKCQLDLAQLSGEEVPSLVADDRSPLFGRSYKAIRPATPTEAEVEAEWYAVADPPESIPSLLVDSYHPSLRGGTGEVGDWSVSALLAQRYPRLMLAGGLTAANVAEAVQKVRPFAVDVASGVESQPGKKDHKALAAFIREAKLAGKAR